MDNTIIGFTGTRNGMSDAQKASVEKLLKGFQAHPDIGNPGVPLIGLHGDCIGADEDFHNICRSLDMAVHQRPCTFDNMRANTDALEISEPVNPMARNLKIVEDCAVLIACPPTVEELKRSGTWATTRMGRKAGDVQVIIVRPDGSVVVDSNGVLGDPVYN